MEAITFVFSGGMADDEELNFYEAGRFQYGAARFIYTLEKFRQQGRVAARLTAFVKADIRVKAPKPGSFVQDIIILALPAIAECAIRVPLDAMIAYVWDLLLPSTKPQDAVVELAKLELAREAERTAQEKERTRQTLLIKDIVTAGSATTAQALNFVKGVIADKEAGAKDMQHISDENINHLMQELDCVNEREILIKENYEELSKIDLTLQRKLTRQMRNSVRNMALPLRSSATYLSVGAGDRARRYARIDAEAARFITDQIEDTVPTPLRGSVKMIDVETGIEKSDGPSTKSLSPFGCRRALALCWATLLLIL